MSKQVRVLLYLFCVLFFGPVFHSQAQSRALWISGQVLRESDKTPIAGVSVFQKSTGQGMATNEQGQFRIQIPPSDTLVFRALGFKNKQYVPSLRSVTEIRINIVLEVETVQLQEVKVTPFATPEKVDRVLRNMKPRPAPPKPRLNPTIPVFIVAPGPPAEINPFASPLSFLYEQFSKQGKQRTRLAQLVAAREQQKTLERLILRQDSIRQARLRYNRFFRDTTSYFDPRW